MSTELQAPVLSIARAQKLPCSVLVAIWAIARQGKFPSNPMSRSAWRALDPELWDEVNIVDHSRPWSGPPALQKVFGGRVQRFGTIRGASPPLTKNRWYAVQRWCSSQSGHAYLVYVNSDGSYRVIDSSEATGFRDRTLSAWHRDGCDHMVLEFPGRSTALIVGASIGAGVLSLGLLWALYRYTRRT
jgi:hypothetical protein